MPCPATELDAIGLLTAVWGMCLYFEETKNTFGMILPRARRKWLRVRARHAVPLLNKCVVKRVQSSRENSVLTCQATDGVDSTLPVRIKVIEG